MNEFPGIVDNPKKGRSYPGNSSENLNQTRQNGRDGLLYIGLGQLSCENGGDETFTPYGMKWNRGVPLPVLNKRSAYVPTFGV